MSDSRSTGSGRWSVSLKKSQRLQHRPLGFFELVAKVLEED